MKINEIMEFENKIFRCDDHDIYVKVVHNNGIEVIASRYIDEFTEQSPPLEQVCSLNDILSMDFVECNEYSIKDVLSVDNEGREFRMLNYHDIIRVGLTMNTIPAAYVIGCNGEPEGLIEDVYTLDSIVNAKFMEVQYNEYLRCYVLFKRK